MVFDQFANFNRPELSEKDQLVLFPVSVFVNVCAYTVFQGMLCGQNSQRLFQHLQAWFWGRSEWQVFKHEVEILARRVAFEKYGLITPSVKKSVMRHLYKDLVGDSAAAQARLILMPGCLPSLISKSQILCLI